VARVLIIGCGCRGQALARELVSRGHAVRGTTRREARQGPIKACGAEPYIGDPDRMSTLVPAFAHTGVACVLLGSAVGSAEELQALHTTRLDMLMEKMLDTTVRAVVYEASGSVDPELLREGVARVRHWCERSLIPYKLLTADPHDYPGWTAAAVGAVEGALLADVQPS
jgi:uncharacterized protein YbjT (DUF2867 family)